MLSVGDAPSGCTASVHDRKEVMYDFIGAIMVLGFFLPAPIFSANARWANDHGKYRIINTIVWFVVQSLSQVASVSIFVSLVSYEGDYSLMAGMGMLGMLAISAGLPIASAVALHALRKVTVTVKW